MPRMTRGTPGHVRTGISDHHYDDWGEEQSGPCEALATLGGEGGVPVARCLITGQDDEVPSPGVASARGASSEIHQAINHLGLDGGAGEGPAHAPVADDLPEVAHISERRA